MALSKELYERFMKVDPATLGHHIGGGFMRPEMKPLNRAVKMLGPAYTVRMEGRDAAPLHYAFTKAEKGSVIVVDRCGDRTYACVGDIVALAKAEKTVAREDMIRQRYLAGGSNIVNIEALYEGKPLDYINQLKKR